MEAAKPDEYLSNSAIIFHPCGDRTSDRFPHRRTVMTNASDTMTDPQAGSDTAPLRAKSGLDHRTRRRLSASPGLSRLAASRWPPSRVSSSSA